METQYSECAEWSPFQNESSVSRFDPGWDLGIIGEKWFENCFPNNSGFPWRCLGSISAHFSGLNRVCAKPLFSLSKACSFSVLYPGDSVCRSVIAKQERQRNETTIVVFVVQNISAVRTFQNAVFNGNTLKTEPKKCYHKSLKRTYEKMFQFVL